MLPRNHPDRIRIAFDDRHQAAVNAGLLFPATQYLKHGVGLNHLPSGRFAANDAWLSVQVMAHNLARWTVRIGLGEQVVTTKTLRRRFCSIAGRLTRSARRSPCICHSTGLGKPSSVAPSLDCDPFHSLPDGTAGADPPTRLPNRFEDSRQVGPRASLAVAALTISPSTRHRGPSTSPLRGYRTLLPAISIGIKPSPSLSLASHPLSDQHGYIPSVDSSLGGEVSATRRRMRRSTGFRIPEGTSQLPRSSCGIPSRRRPPPNPSPSGAPPGHPTSRNRPHSGCFPLHAEASR